MGTPSYEGKQVYMGLDVHREFFVASCICDGVVVKRCRMPGTAEAVISLVNPARVIFEKKSLAIAGRAQSWRSQVAP